MPTFVAFAHKSPAANNNDNRGMDEESAPLRNREAASHDHPMVKTTLGLPVACSHTLST